jgi:hypothetical protein
MSSCNALIRTREDRRFLRRCQIVACAEVSVYVTCEVASLHCGQTPLGFALAVVAGAAIFSELFAVGLIVMKRLDEFQRALMTQAFVWATVLTLFLATLYGFLELNGRGLFPKPSLLFVPVVLIVLTALMKVIVFRRHRSPAE